jgi:two-component system, NtrC family, response regulator HydG
MKKILIIDDDTDMCALLVNLLNKKGYETDFAHSGAKGLKKFKEDKFDLVMSDYRLGDMEGGKLLTEIKKVDSHANVIIFTGYEDIKTAVNVIKLGAFDYIVKPLIPDEVLSTVEKSFDRSANTSVAATTTANNNVTVTPGKKMAAGTPAPGGYLVGNAPNTKELYRQISLVAPTDYSVILYGESGTGKEVMARTIHQLSHRKDKPFIAMDCGTLSKDLAASELFGYVKGAFTGAVGDKEGHFELANGGTLFLDEVANLSYDIQASLLRVIQERKVKRVGGVKEIDLDVRIIVASNEDLQHAYHVGKFREDLFHRFNEFSISIPPLRDRKDDIPLFAEFFLQQANSELNKNLSGFESEVMDLFLNYSWPGNLRELRNVIRKAALLSNGTSITKKMFPVDTMKMDTQPAPGVENLPMDAVLPAAQNLKSAAFMAEYHTILNALKKVNFNKTKAAELLNIDRKTLYNKLKAFELLM